MYRTLKTPLNTDVIKKNDFQAAASHQVRVQQLVAFLQAHDEPPGKKMTKAIALPRAT